MLMIEASDIAMLCLNNPQSLPPLILASGSPRRKELLTSLGLSFDVVLPTVDEKTCNVGHLSPIEAAKTLAHFKGQSIAALYPDSLVISADTIVVLENEILGKPDDTVDACQMLSRLQGQTHTVISAISIFYHGSHQGDAWETHVKMRTLTPDNINWYVSTGEPLDKAGSYAIQGHGSLLVEKIEGCYFNVVGMSLVLLDNLISKLIS